MRQIPKTARRCRKHFKIHPRSPPSTAAVHTFRYPTISHLSLLRQYTHTTFLPSLLLPFPTLLRFSSSFALLVSFLHIKNSIINTSPPTYRVILRHKLPQPYYHTYIPIPTPLISSAATPPASFALLVTTHWPYSSLTMPLPLKTGESAINSTSDTSTSLVGFSLMGSTPALRAVLAANIQAEVSRNDESLVSSEPSAFYGKSNEECSVEKYIIRASRYAFCSNICFVAAYHYMQKAVESDKDLVLDSFSFHRLFIAAVFLACKYFEDVRFDLAYYSRVGGIQDVDLKFFELELLLTLDFNLTITKETFLQVENALVNRIRSIQMETFKDPVVLDLCKKASRELDSVYSFSLEFPSDHFGLDSTVKETGPPGF